MLLYVEKRTRRLDKPTGCDIEDCERPHYSNGLCVPHWQRRQKYGDPLAGPPMRKQRQPSPRTGTTSEYHVKHRMVREARGPAWQQKCQKCGGPAADWATRHGTDGSSPEHFMPLCRRCHIIYDDAVARLPDNTGSKRTPEQKERMRQAALKRWSDPAQVELARKNALAREARKRASRG
jgi:hypothetical protein